MEESGCNFNTAFKCHSGLSSPVDTVRSSCHLSSASAPAKVSDVAVGNVIHLHLSVVTGQLCLLKASPSRAFSLLLHGAGSVDGG